MTKVQKMKIEVKEALTETIQEGMLIMSSIVEVLDENPEFEKVTVDLIQKYIRSFKPIVVKINNMGEVMKIVEQHGSDATEVVKLVLGR